MDSAEKLARIGTLHVARDEYGTLFDPTFDDPDKLPVGDHPIFIESARAQPQAESQDAKDAARYRWLRSCDADDEDLVMVRCSIDGSDNLLSDGDLDAAIDAAMERTP